MSSAIDPEILLMLENTQRAAARIAKERDAALRDLEAAAAQLDAMREAWHISQAQLAREREVAHAAMKRALELHREIMRGSAAVRYGLSPAQWVEALGIAKSERPDLWREEEES